MSVKKITVVGGGHVGATCSQLLAMKELAREVVLVDILEGVPMGKGLDQWESAPIDRFDSRVAGTNSYDDAADSDIFIVTAGVARKPGMSRDDLLKTNAGIVKSVSEEIKRVAPNSIVIMVSNPLDVMAQVALETTGFPRERVIGMAGVLDSARYRSFIALELDVSVEDIQALVLGGHGDTMVPLPRYSAVAGIPIPDLVKMGWTTQKKINDIIKRTRSGGGEIVALLKSGSAYYAPASAAISMAESYLKDQKRVLPCAAHLTGQFGIKDLYVGVPVVIGEGGVERVVEINMNAAEKKQFNSSVDAVKGLLDACRKIDPSLGKGKKGK